MPGARPVLLDVLTACQTSASLEVILEYLNFDDEYYIELPERYLLGVAFSTHPSKELLTALWVSHSLHSLLICVLILCPLYRSAFWQGIMILSVCLSVCLLATNLKNDKHKFSIN